MGCCLTTTSASDNFKIHSKTRDTSPPLPPGSAEEKVKEVVSVTLPKKNLPQTNSISAKLTPDNILHSEDEFKSKDVVVQMTKHLEETNASEVSSEVYTYSASDSAATTTTTLGTGIDIDAHGDEVTQKVNNRPPPVKIMMSPTPCSLQRARRHPSPARRVPVVLSTDKNPQLTSRSAQRKRNKVSSSSSSYSKVVQHKPAFRVSKSPVLLGEAAGQLTVKNSGERVALNERKNEVNIKVKKACNNVSTVMVVPEAETTHESLDNPFVSLECFIFL